MCNVTIEHEKSDKRLITDSFKLKGICSFRIGKVLEAVRCFNQANRIKEDF